MRMMFWLAARLTISIVLLAGCLSTTSTPESGSPVLPTTDSFAQQPAPEVINAPTPTSTKVPEPDSKDSVEAATQALPTLDSLPQPSPNLTITPSPIPTDASETEPIEVPTTIPAVVQMIYPTPFNLSAEGQAAYDNIVDILLSENEVNPLYDPGLETWRFEADSSGLYSTCRNFVNSATPNTGHSYYFSCVYVTVPGFDLLTGDIGIYDVIQSLDSTLAYEYPSVVNAYQSENGFGIDRLIQFGRFILISGVVINVPLGENLQESFTEFLDTFLYDTGRIMLTKALQESPEPLDFPESASAENVPEYLKVLIKENGFAGWEVGEPDDYYDDGVCRTFYKEDGPPPVLVNCVFLSSRFNLSDWLGNYQDTDFIDMSLETKYVYDAPYFIFMDFTDGGYPRYAFAQENEGMLIMVDLIMPGLLGEMVVDELFTDQIDDILRQAVLNNLSSFAGQ